METVPTHGGLTGLSILHRVLDEFEGLNQGHDRTLNQVIVFVGKDQIEGNYVMFHRDELNWHPNPWTFCRVKCANVLGQGRGW